MPGLLCRLQGAVINVLGAGATMLGLSATIGVLLAKTLTSATVNPFLATSSTNWNPVLAFDVFNVQVGAAQSADGRVAGRADAAGRPPASDGSRPGRCCCRLPILVRPARPVAWRSG